MGDFFTGFGIGFLGLATVAVAAQVLLAAYQRHRELAEVQRQHKLQRAEAAIPPREWPPQGCGVIAADGTFWTAEDIMRQEG